MDENSYKSLCQQSIEKCIFCDEFFENRYEALVHTASHIIIPLLKQELHQCPVCLFHFSSIELHYHTFMKHPELAVFPEEFSSVNCVTEDNKNLKTEEIQNSSPDLLASFIKNEPIVQCEILPPLDTPIRNRIVFEDGDTFDDQKDDACIEDTSTANPTAAVHESNFQSVHYDELKMSGSYSCTKCERKFENRYELIIHSRVHIRFKRNKLNLCRVCERYIPGNYKNLKVHLETKHPGIKKKLSNLTKCRKCNLWYYNYNRHFRNYHEIYKCLSCGRGFEAEFERDNHWAKCTSTDWDPRMNRRWDSKVHKVCDLCFTFFKNRSNLQYVVIDDFSEMGSRQNCFRCGHKFFELKLVKFWYLSRMDVDFREKRKKGPLSNEDRLSKIQKRLKMLKMRYWWRFILLPFVT